MALATSLPVSAASVSATLSSNSINVGGSVSVDLFLNLGATETASIFEGKFGLGGLGSITGVTIDSTGPSWSSAAKNISGGNALLSLTSNNLGDPSRLLATLTFTGLAPGVSNLTYSADTFASFDIPAFPFSSPLTLSNVDGGVLATVAVVPEPSTFASLLLGLGAVGAIGVAKRRKAN